MRKTSYKYDAIWVTTLILFFFLTLPVLSGTVPGEYREIVNSLTFRNIGPANMGGRTVDIAVVEGDTSIIYAAVGPAGIWKSVNNGITWLPVFEKESSVSVGTVAVSVSHPDMVWVGSGEATCRNSVAIGDGVYKSNDGGKTWKNMGLRDTRHIAEIAIDPHNPDIVYVAALGHLWGANKERGVFKTTDGGKTWKKVLYFDEDTGIADLVMDPGNSRTLYAAAYNFRRLPYYFRSGGEHGGIYKTVDGGETWKRLEKGLPEGVNGRIGLAVYRKNPAIVYACVENEKGGIFRSDDKGENWVRTGDKETYDKVNFRPFYYSKITVDPNNDQVLYAYSGQSYVSRDGGKTFKRISRDIHPDHHTLWVDPNNSRHIIDGNDGGIDISWDGGETWYQVENATWSQVYQVGYDMGDPYHVFAGLQDNGSWGCPVDSRDKKGIMNLHWYPVGGGDGFYVQVDPQDPNILYRNLQMGNIERFHRDTGQTQPIIPRAGLDDEPYRFNWNSPILVSRYDKKTVYFGGNFLFKSTDRGHSWQKISPDLSTGDPKKIVDSGGPISPDNTGAEVHCTIYTISDSPLQEGLIWVGSDDGNLYLTRDGGKTWQDVTQNVKGLPSNSWVSRVEASRFRAGTAYVTFDRHRSDDYRPYVYKTDNFGKTWKSLASSLPSTGYLHVVREDTKNENLLYLGSEFGLFVSLDRGGTWLPVNKNFPTAAVRDIAVHPRERDLIVGTHGRGVWILDDLTPLQQLNNRIVQEPVYFFDVSPGTVYYKKNASEYYSDPVFAAPNPPFGTALTYYLKEAAQKEEKIELHIYHEDGTLIRTLEGGKDKGLNRVYWDLRSKPVFEKMPEVFKGQTARFFGVPRGHFVLPGNYKAVLAYKTTKIERQVVVKAAKDQDFALQDRIENNKIVTRLNKLLRRVFEFRPVLTGLGKSLQTLGKKLPPADGDPAPFAKRFETLKEKCGRLEKEIGGGGFDGYYRRPLKTALRGGPVAEQLFMQQRAVNNFPGPVTQTQKERIAELEQKVGAMLREAEDLIKKEVPQLNKLLRENDIDHIKLVEMPK